MLRKDEIFGGGGKGLALLCQGGRGALKSILDTSLLNCPKAIGKLMMPLKCTRSLRQLRPGTTAGSNVLSRNGSMGITGDDTPKPTTSSILSGANTAAPAPMTEIGPKKPGVVRIGLASVKTGAVGEGLAAADLAAAVQNALRDYLRVPNAEVVVLDARLASAIDAEAKDKECDLVLYANVSHKKGGGGFGMFKAIAPVLSSVAPMAGMAGMAGAVAGSAVITAASVSGNVKAKDELTLDVKLNKVDGSTSLMKQFKVKAKSNGDDIISAAVEQAAQAVVDTLEK